MSDFAPIHGTVFVKLSDQLLYIVLAIRQKALLLFMSLLCVGFVVSSDSFSHEVSVARAHHGSVPMAILVAALSVAVTSLIKMLPLVTLFVVVFTALGVRRMGIERRTLTYEIGADGMRTRDGLGAELFLPWTNVAWTRMGKRLLLVKIKPRMLRYVILRAFPPEDQQKLAGFLAARTA